MMRLEADRVPFSFYEGQAIERGIPLTTGIGSSQIDRNSIGDINIEDVNGQSEFELIEIIIKTARENGALGQIN